MLLFKDAATALLILIANFAILFLAVFIYSLVINPGQPEEFYAGMAPEIARWTAPIGGGVLFFLAILFRARRLPARNSNIIALSTWIFYVILDIALGAAASGGSVLSIQLTLSLLVALTGGLLGAVLARGRA